ncbi:MAG: TIGR00730 family Rossman fold protein [Candidatus Magasanikbacteria bacterium]|nr:TIGR00730 family Rossman fold protein [Candidatus Magasanikbacteria bacterium]MCA9391056.1 TIGR00730 family Rossman fold protein [Candidatus Magasanikbacteria bacterium]USN53015.1 MAG: TIGR00730 family Rossman fold protein [Candidatus Nomurabacteria bacterium]
MAEFVEGFEFLSRLHQEVSVFGSARCSHKDPYYAVARKIGSLCAKHGYTMVTGGGPGMMEAANRGAFEAKGESIGLTIQLPMEQRTNKYVKRSVDFHYFFTRKVMLSASAQAYVFMPGGFGTLDELFEIVTLIQTGKMSDGVPVILVGKEFWKPLLGWIKKRVLDAHGYIAKGDLDIFHLVETAEEAFEIIKTTRERSL